MGRGHLQLAGSPRMRCGASSISRFGRRLREDIDAIRHQSRQQRSPLQRLLGCKRDTIRQAPYLGIVAMRQLIEQFGATRRFEVGLTKQHVVAVIVAIPERHAAPEESFRASARVNHQMGKAVNFQVINALAEPLRMLVGGMTHFKRLQHGQCRHAHAVVIDQLHAEQTCFAARHQQDIAVLQIAMGQVRVAQPPGQLHPDLAELLQNLGLVQVILDELVKWQPLGPFHL